MKITNNYRCDRCAGDFPYEETVEIASEVYCQPCAEVVLELICEEMDQDILREQQTEED